jgi:hypothetical protein
MIRMPAGAKAFSPCCEVDECIVVRGAECSEGEDILRSSREH